MADEKVLIEALASDGFKVSVHDKKRTETFEMGAADETRKQFGEDPHSIVTSSHHKNNDTKSLLAVVKGMSAGQRQKLIELLKQKGLGDPLTKEQIVQNAFTVEQTIRASVSS